MAFYADPLRVVWNPDSSPDSSLSRLDSVQINRVMCTFVFVLAGCRVRDREDQNYCCEEHRHSSRWKKVCLSRHSSHPVVLQLVSFQAESPEEWSLVVFSGESCLTAWIISLCVCVANNSLTSELLLKYTAISVSKLSVWLPLLQCLKQ